MISAFIAKKIKLGWTAAGSGQNISVPCRETFCLENCLGLYQNTETEKQTSVCRDVHEYNQWQILQEGGLIGDTWGSGNSSEPKACLSIGKPASL